MLRFMRLLLMKMVDDWRATLYHTEDLLSSTLALLHSVAWLWMQILSCAAGVGLLCAALAPILSILRAEDGFIQHFTARALQRSNEQVGLAEALGSLETRIDALEKQLILGRYYDGVGMFDYASLPAGGRVVHELTSGTHAFHKYAWYQRWLPWSSPATDAYPPEYGITPETQYASCWPMNGRTGALGISLSTPISIGYFTIDHVPRNMTLHHDTAPRTGELWGLLDDNDTDLATMTTLTTSTLSDVMKKTGSDAPRSGRFTTSPWVLLGSFTYDMLADRPDQTFCVPTDVIRALGPTKMGTVILSIQDNWGSEDYTCLYRIRVHATCGSNSLKFLTFRITHFYRKYTYSRAFVPMPMLCPVSMDDRKSQWSRDCAGAAAMGTRVVDVAVLEGVIDPPIPVSAGVVSWTFQMHCRLGQTGKQDGSAA
ncbi:hypothetical protein BV20DRAFT_995225 [Pilatotrama ljubarskyi]|nr:hypothetical protein BV20DRAFT_995225 [Pilatotrama ljubarskyi]